MTNISGIFLQGGGKMSTLIAVEEGTLSRWWHTYTLGTNGWVLSSTHHEIEGNMDDDVFVDLSEGLVGRASCARVGGEVAD
jgi:hypothetical protein